MIRVKVDNRNFHAIVDDAGQVISVTERKIYAEGRPFQSYYNQHFWPFRNKEMPKNKDCVTYKVLEAIKNKVNAAKTT